MMKHVLIDISNILIIIIAFHEIADAVSLSQGRAHITICEITSYNHIWIQQYKNSSLSIYCFMDAW